jgi:hypothetical protein
MVNRGKEGSNLSRRGVSVSIKPNQVIAARVRRKSVRLTRFLEEGPAGNL